MTIATIRNISYKLILPLTMLSAGIISVFFGKDLCWDLANYHYYIPFAFLHNRQQLDFWPSSYLHQYLNPGIDFLSYYLITYFKPSTVEFILGAIHGINIWLLFLIARQFQFSTRLSLFLAIFGICGPTALPGIGSFQNDALISIFVLSFVFLQLRSINHLSISNSFPYTLQFGSGLCLGIGFGLKFTAGIYIAGSILTTLILPISSKQKFMSLILWGSGALVGVLLSAGYWMHQMWQLHNNPFFPFLNGIFQSVDFAATSWRDTRSMPQGILQTIFYPFYFSFDGRIVDGKFRDFRFAVIYLLFVFAGFHYIWHKLKDVPNPALSLQQSWIYAFLIFSYIVWQYYFSIGRYMVASEMLTPIVIYLLLQQLIRSTQGLTAISTLIFYGLLVTLIPTPMIRTPRYATNYFNINMSTSIANIENATVLIAYPAFAQDINPRPQTYLIPFFPAKWHFIGVPFLHETYMADEHTTETIKKLIGNRNEKIFLLTTDRNMPSMLFAAKQFQLQPSGACEKIASDRQIVTYQKTLLCPVNVEKQANF